MAVVRASHAGEEGIVYDAGAMAAAAADAQVKMPWEATEVLPYQSNKPLRKLILAGYCSDCPGNALIMCDLEAISPIVHWAQPHRSHTR